MTDRRTEGRVAYCRQAVFGYMRSPSETQLSRAATLLYTVISVESGWSPLRHPKTKELVLGPDGELLFNFGGAHAGFPPCRAPKADGPVELDWVDHKPNGAEYPVCLWGYRSGASALDAEARLLIGAYKRAMRVAVSTGVRNGVIALGLQNYYGGRGDTESERFSYYLTSASSWVSRIQGVRGASYYGTGQVAEHEISAVRSLLGR